MGLFWSIEGEAPTRLTHTGAAFDSAEMVERAFSELDSALADRDRAQTDLLIDLRAASLRNDPAVRLALDIGLKRSFSGFRTLAILVESQAGVKQIQRQGRQLGLGFVTFSTTAAALAFIARRAATG